MPTSHARCPEDQHSIKLLEGVTVTMTVPTDLTNLDATLTEQASERHEKKFASNMLIRAYYYQQLLTTFLQFPTYKVIIGSLRAS